MNDPTSKDKIGENPGVLGKLDGGSMNLSTNLSTMGLKKCTNIPPNHRSIKIPNT